MFPLFSKKEGGFPPPPFHCQEHVPPPPSSVPLTSDLTIAALKGGRQIPQNSMDLFSQHPHGRGRGRSINNRCCMHLCLCRNGVLWILTSYQRHLLAHTHMCVLKCCLKNECVHTCTVLFAWEMYPLPCNLTENVRQLNAEGSSVLGFWLPGLECSGSALKFTKGH